LASSARLTASSLEGGLKGRARAQSCLKQSLKKISLLKRGSARIARKGRSGGAYQRMEV
jgi:hypothetical protein